MSGGGVVKEKIGKLKRSQFLATQLKFCARVFNNSEEFGAFVKPVSVIKR